MTGDRRRGSGRRSTDEDRVVACDRAEFSFERRCIEHHRQRIGMAGPRLADDHLAPVSRREQFTPTGLLQRMVEHRSPAQLNTRHLKVLRKGIPLRRLDDLQVAQISRQRGLRDIDPVIAQGIAQRVLAGEGLRSEQAADPVLSCRFRDHVHEYTTRCMNMQSAESRKFRKSGPPGPTLPAMALRDRLIGSGTLISAAPIGDDRGFTGKLELVSWTEPGETEVRRAVLKYPETDENFERCAREVLFYEAVGDQLRSLLPAFLGGAVDAAAGTVEVALAFEPGRDLDAATGCSPDEASGILRALARLHAAAVHDSSLTDHDWMPRWGQGQIDRAHPHRRRAERYRKRAIALRDSHGPVLAPALREEVDRLDEDFESLLETVATYEPTLIHADMHLDNLIMRTDGSVCILDWQSVSHGPAEYDVARLLTDAIRGDDQERIPDLLQTYIDERAALDAPVDDSRSFVERTAIMGRVVMAGFVSGSGGMSSATPPRLRAMFERSMAPDAMIGAQIALQRAALQGEP